MEEDQLPINGDLLPAVQPPVREPTADEKLQDTACDGNYLEAVRLVEEEGANPSGVEDLQKPLALAALFGHVQIVDYLLQKGADVNGSDLNGDSALLNAVCYRDRLQIVKMLLDHGADLYHTNWVNKSAIDRAREYNNEEIVNFLTNYMNNSGA